MTLVRIRLVVTVAFFSQLSTNGFLERNEVPANFALVDTQRLELPSNVG